MHNQSMARVILLMFVVAFGCGKVAFYPSAVKNPTTGNIFSPTIEKNKEVKSIPSVDLKEKKEPIVTTKPKPRISRLTGRSIVLYENNDVLLRQLSISAETPSNGQRVLGVWSVSRKHTNTPVRFEAFDVEISLKEKSVSRAGIVFRTLRVISANRKKTPQHHITPCQPSQEENQVVCRTRIIFQNEKLSVTTPSVYALTANVPGEKNQVEVKLTNITITVGEPLRQAPPRLEVASIAK